MMAIRYASDGSLPLIPLGNGKILLWEEGVSIFSLRTGYTSPHLLSLTPALGECYHEAEVLVREGSGRLFRLCFTDETLQAASDGIYDLQISDSLLPDSPIFVRRMEGMTASEWRLLLPPYVKKVYHPAYRFQHRRADVLFLSLPAGTPVDGGGITTCERNAAIVLAGAIRYDPESSVLRHDGDPAALYILCHDDPAEMVRTGERLLAQLEESETLPQETVESSPVNLLIETLLTLQGEDGGLISSHRSPYADALSLPVLTAAFLRAGEQEAARRMLLRFGKAAAEAGQIPSRLPVGTGAVLPDTQPDRSAVAAYLWAATDYLRSADITDEQEKTFLFRGMRRAFAYLMQGMREGMLPFSSGDLAFEAGLLPRELLFQGSAEATALAIAAGRSYLAYCRESGKRAAREEQGYLTALAEAETRFAANFTHEAKIVRNSLRPEGYRRRSRFVRGVCVLCRQTGAYSSETTLELDKYGRYLCRGCFATRRNTPEISDPGARYRSPRATALAALVTGVPAALRELPELALAYAAKSCTLPLREGDTDPLLLLALKERREEICTLLTEEQECLSVLAARAAEAGFTKPSDGMDAAAALVEFLIGTLADHLRRLIIDGGLPALLCGDRPLGGRMAASSTALAALALME